MAIIEIKEVFESRKSVFEFGNKQRHTRRFWITTEGDAADHEVAVAEAEAMPKTGDAHPDNPAARLKTKTIEYDRRSRKVLWATLDYDTETEEAPSNDPLLRPPEVRIGFVQYTREANTDKDDKAIKNKAGDPLIYEQEDNRLAMYVTRNVAAVNWSLLAAYINKPTCNKDTFAYTDLVQVYRHEPKTAYLASASAALVFESGVRYYTVPLEFHINPNGWNPRRFRNEGLRYLRNDVLVNVGAENGQISNVPVLLDANGGLLADDADPVFIEADTYEEEPFVLLFR